MDIDFAPGPHSRYAPFSRTRIDLPIYVIQYLKNLKRFLLTIESVFKDQKNKNLFSNGEFTTAKHSTLFPNN